VTVEQKLAMLRDSFGPGGSVREPSDLARAGGLSLSDTVA